MAHADADLLCEREGIAESVPSRDDDSQLKMAYIKGVNRGMRRLDNL